MLCRKDVRSAARREDGKGDDMATAPKYEAGMVIDIRFTRNSMPDRIFIDMVYQKAKSTEWMYNVYSEKSDKYIFMSESQIEKSASHKTAKCYEHEVVQQMYESGFRFAGNNKAETAMNRAYSMVNAKYIKHIILAEAIGEDGSKMDGYLGLWVQYNNVIEADGSFTKKNLKDVQLPMVIK